MSVANSLQQIDTSVYNTLKLRTDLEFDNGTIQQTAYEGAGGVPTLEEVLITGNDAQGLNIDGVGTLTADTVVANTQIQLLPTGNTVNFAGEINQIALGAGFNGNQLLPTIITSNAGQGTSPALIVSDNTLGDGLYVLPNASNNAFSNPFVNAGDLAIVASSVTQPMAICCDSATTNGVRITDTSVSVGAGGNADTPSCNISFNATANQIISTSPSSFIIQTPDISATPTLIVAETTTNNSLIVIPKSDGGQYNPLDTNNAVEMVAWINGLSRDNGQILAIAPHSATSCGFRASAGTGGVGTNAYLEVGCGGGGADPTQRIRFDNATSQIQMAYTGLAISTGALPNTAGASSGFYLPVTINGVVYKIALLANA